MYKLKSIVLLPHVNVMERVPDDDRPLRKIFSQLPPQVGLVGGTRKCVEEYLVGSPLTPDRRRIYPKSAAIVSALLAPEPERPSVRNRKKVGEGMAPDTATQPRVYGINNLFPIISDLLRPDNREGDHETVHLQLGIGADAPLDATLPAHLNLSPALPAYITLGLERLKALTEVTDRVRLRVFSTGSLIAKLNKKDPDQIKAMQGAQRELIEAFIREFYPDLASLVDTEDITAEIPKVGRGKYTAVRDRVMTRLTPALITTLEESGKKYGCTRIEDVIRYAVNHCLPATFRDGSEEKYHISVGGWSEDPFMAIRGFNEPTDTPQYRMGVVVRGVLARTPAYLNRISPKMFPEITMTEILTQGNARVAKFLEAPHSDRSGYSRDLVHLGRVVGGVDHDEMIDGLHHLHRFYQQLYNRG